MNLFEKIQAIRVDLKNEELKQTGWNSYAEYSYFELDDFLTPLNRLMKEYKMTAIPSFNREVATLTAINIENPEEMFTITSPFGSAQLKGCHEVQNIGATETYQRRYLYQALFDISESDALNKTQGKPSKTSKQSKSNDNPQTKEKSQITANNEPKQAINIEAAKTITLNFGKYNGKTLAEIYESDRGYMEWLADNSQKEAVKEAARLLLEQDLPVLVKEIEITEDDLPF